ncbi:phosphate/phosphite/phosphonate ABC transporter substrate-binding protein [Scytonema sp. NUACC26]|uniref:phosphate/phosphite/phosphonate ABC transporter substrate-binding protein n=1 Tax=Scytonema sp. NUACC26 TaxID=3140176 RepID=UPI0034DC31E3
MSFSFSRRYLFFQLLLLTACAVKSTHNQGDRLIIGIISYEQGEKTRERLTRFSGYLAEKTGARVEIEPAFNENLAIRRIQDGAWSLVFAPPGLAAIAMAKHQYVALFPLLGNSNLQSLFVVRQDSPIQELKGLQQKTVALGYLGSATGYYLPLYNLYGLTLAEIQFAPTPKTVLEWIAQEKVTAGALSNEEFNLYSPDFSTTPFRILFTDTHKVPPGVVLISPSIEHNRQDVIRKIMNAAVPVLTQELGYVPNGKLPDYQYMISVVERVTSIANEVHNKPARLF